jgi:hypothetical protein
MIMILVEKSSDSDEVVLNYAEEPDTVKIMR